MITENYVRRIFEGLEQGDGAGFFEHVDDKVDWIVEGTHPLAGHYKSKSDFVAGTFAKLAEVLPRARRRASARQGRSGGRRTSFLGDREEWSQIRQPLLLGLPLCKRRDSRGPSLSRFCPRGPPFCRESDLTGAILRSEVSPAILTSEGCTT